MSALTELNLSIVLLLSSFLIGILGAMSGLGGGSILTPVLYLFLGVDLRYAMGSSLIAAIATSSGAAAAYVKEGYTNLRVGMFLEIATVSGAIFGALLAAIIQKNILCIIFGLVMFQSAWLALHAKPDASVDTEAADPLAEKFSLNSSYPLNGVLRDYKVHNVRGGFFMMLVAGCLSGLLGIGSGPLKVLAMDQMMKLPFKVSTTTSNFMIGVTAAASAGVYMNRGFVDPILCAPVMLGMVAGSMIGARLLPKVDTKLLRKLFAILIVIVGIEMIYKGLGGKL